MGSASMERAMMGRTKFISAGVALLALLNVVNGSQAAVNQSERAGSAVEPISSTALGAAELDPVFGQKLTDRVRGPYQRSHQVSY